ncbi:Alkylated DNA repair protein alkB like protein 8 [Eufriesea mexicana]|nr:Alkylated DNA repair protein alkB like protein 8 [Eufriesea mexicana]
MICNAGLVTGFQRNILQDMVNSFVNKYDLIMPPNKSYCFIKLYSIEDAIYVHNKIHANIKVSGQNTPLYATFTESVPDLNYYEWSLNLPPGLKLIENIITEEEERRLLSTINWNNEGSSDLKHRKVKHFGYEFQYNSNKVDPDQPITPIPEDYHFLKILFKKYHDVPYEYDQLTINHYLPACIMDFKRENEKVAIFLPPRSLLIMSGEARYAWSHGICPRHNDIVSTSTGMTTQPRGTRVSFTFRKVYDKISNHFDETRHKQWPNVSKFLETLNTGDILLDVGCGNGKYLYQHKNIFKVGCDRSYNLMKICRSKNFEVFLSDCLYLPYKDNSLDAIICIAVIHHLSTHERRKQAIFELARILRPNGKCLIYVWAKEQEKDSIQTAYLRYDLVKKEDNISWTQKLTEYGVTLPIHTNRTKFVSNDLLVPWKRKGGGNFLRYYHVFEENELSQLCSEVKSFTIQEVYYDQGNWCVILQKKE